MADERKVNLRVGLDGSEVKAGLEGIKDEARKAGEQISDSANKASKGFEGISNQANNAKKGLADMGDQAPKTEAKVDKASRSIIAAIERATASAKAGEKGTAAYFETLGAQRGVGADVLKPYLENLREVEAAQKKGGKTSDEWAEAARRAGISNAQFTAAMRGTPAQISDIVVSLQGGMNPMTVFMQQGFQLRDMFNGWRPAAEALSVSLMKMVTPWTLSAAAVGLFAYQAYQAEQRLQKMSALKVQFGVTDRDLGIDQINALVKRLAELPGVSKAAATDMVSAFATVRQVGSGMLEPLLALTNDYAAATGKQVPAAAKALADAFRDPEAGAKSLNAELGILSAEQAVSIDKFLEQGRVADAQAVLLDALTAKVKGLAHEGMTPLGASADALAKAWGHVKDSFSNTETLTETNKVLASMVGKIAWLLEYGAKIKAGPFGLPDLRESAGIDGLIGIPRRSTGGATGTWTVNPAAAPRPAQPGRGEQQAWEDYVTKLLDSTKQYKAARDEAGKLREELGRLQEAQKRQAAAGKTQSADELGERIAGVRERIKSLDKKAGAEGSMQAYGALGIDIEKIKGEYEKLANIYTHSEKLIELARKSGTISEQDYYTAKRGFIQLNADAKEKELADEIARYQATKVSAEKSFEVRKKIESAQADLDKARMDRGLKLAELDAQQEAATRAKTSALLAYRLAAKDAYDTTNRAYARDLETAWMGGNASRYAQGQSQIEERYSQMRRDLANQRAQAESLSGSPYSAEQQRQYDEQLAIINEFQAKSLASFSSYYQALRAGETDWTNGARRSLANYMDSASNVALQTENIFTKAFTGMEDALVSFATTGKLNFSSLANSIIADLIRMQVRAAMGGSNGILGSLFGGAMALLGGSPAPLASSGVTFGGMDAMNGYAFGGYTGHGAKFEPAGIVHRGEYVINAESTRRVGLDYLNRLNGYANGGLVGGGGGAGPLAGVARVEIINNGAPAQVQSAEVTQGPGGEGVLRLVIAEATKAAVATVADQIANGYGPAHQSLQARSRLGM